MPSKSSRHLSYSLQLFIFYNGLVMLFYQGFLEDSLQGIPISLQDPSPLDLSSTHRAPERKGKNEIGEQRRVPALTLLSLNFSEMLTNGIFMHGGEFSGSPRTVELQCTVFTSSVPPL